MEARVDRQSGEAIEPVRCKAPNRHARPASLEVGNQVATFHGYQEFVLTPLIVLPNDSALRRKQELLAPYFTPRYFSGRQVLDLGANSGFFSFWALQNNADHVVALEIDEDYLQMMKEASAKLGFRGLEVTKANFDDWSEPADVILCLALVHWIFSCTALSESLDSIVEKLARLTRYLLIVEWIDPDDEAIEFFHHLDWNKDFIRAPYTIEAFEAALGRWFSKYDVIGEVGQTRRIYAALKTDLEIDLSGPLPFIFDKESLISSRRLLRHDGIDYWSRIYDGGDVIQKQATLDLALREHYFLSELKSDYFPQAFESRSEDGYSVISLEKIRGIALSDAIQSIRASRSKSYEFIQHCLNILDELQRKEITHRDILSENLILRGERPVLIDFGWAISPTQPVITPGGLGKTGRPPDGSFCDVYSMGKVFDLLNGHRYSEFDWVIERMTEPDNSLRITDVPILRVLFSCVLDSHL